MKRAARAVAAKAAAKAKRIVTLIRRLLTIVVIVAFGLWLVSVSAVLMWSSRDEARPAQAIIVLGAAQYAGKPSPVLRDRLELAIELSNRLLAPLLIPPGAISAAPNTDD